MEPVPFLFVNNVQNWFSLNPVDTIYSIFFTPTLPSCLLYLFIFILWGEGLLLPQPGGNQGHDLGYQGWWTKWNANETPACGLRCLDNGCRIIQLFSGTAGARTKGSSTSLVSSVCSKVTLMHIFTNIQCVPSHLPSPVWGPREEAREKATSFGMLNI